MLSKIEWVENYRSAGFRTLPLINNSKLPAGKFNVIEKLEFSENNNIGLFMGSENGLIVADLDDKNSQKTAEEKFREMGLWEKLTIVKTPRRNGRHVWIKSFDIPGDAKEYYKYDPYIGHGELRLRYKAYVVAPGSAIAEGEYFFEQGGIEAFLAEPVIAWPDLTWLLPNNWETKANRAQREDDTPLSLPIRLLYREKPTSAFKLAEKLQKSKHGDFIPWNRPTNEEKLSGYASTSEAEAALVTNLILAGWDFNRIKVIFDDIAPPHYVIADDGYLLRVFNNVIIYLSDDDLRRRIAEAYQHAMFMPWPGKSGGFDKKILLALLANAWQWRTFLPLMSYRAIAEHAGIGDPAAIAGVERLQKQNYIHKLKIENDLGMQRYDVNPFINIKEHNSSNYIPTDTTVMDVDNSAEIGDLWSRSFLGESASLCYPHTSLSTPVGVNELKVLTGKSRNTVISAMNKLSEFGLAEPVSHNSWLRGRTNPSEVALEIGAVNRAAVRRKRHKEQRIAYAQRQVNLSKQRESNN